MFLEKQIKNVEGTVSGFEEQLAKDGAIPDTPKALQTRSQQLQVAHYTMHLIKFQSINLKVS